MKHCNYWRTMYSHTMCSKWQLVLTNPCITHYPISFAILLSTSLQLNQSINRAIDSARLKMKKRVYLYTPVYTCDAKTGFSC